MTIEFSTISEHAVLAAMEHEGEENVLVQEVYRLMTVYSDRIAKARETGAGAGSVLTPTATTTPIESVAMDLLREAIMEEDER